MFSEIFLRVFAIYSAMLLIYFLTTSYTRWKDKMREYGNGNQIQVIFATLSIILWGVFLIFSIVFLFESVFPYENNTENEIVKEILITDMVSFAIFLFYLFIEKVTEKIE